MKNTLLNEKKLILQGSEFIGLPKDQKLPWYTSYQLAFANDIWKERGKCASKDPEITCPNIYSEFIPGEICSRCSAEITDPAYSEEYLTELFENRATAQKALFYQELVDDQMALGAIAWKSNPQNLCDIKYQNSSGNFKSWLFDNTPQSFGYLEEYWSSGIRESGNMEQFETMITSLACHLQVNVIAYRSIVDKMRNKPKTVFGSRAEIFDINTQGYTDSNRFFVKNTL
jgi:hypothetical protein